MARKRAPVTGWSSAISSDAVTLINGRGRKSTASSTKCGVDFTISLGEILR
jgi:hypothetical protein